VVTNTLRGQCWGQTIRKGCFERIGREILVRQTQEGWGARVIDRISVLNLALVSANYGVYGDEANTAWVRVSRIGKLMSAAAAARAISAYHIH
jgi:hypothetical protein